MTNYKQLGNLPSSIVSQFDEACGDIPRAKMLKKLMQGYVRHKIIGTDNLIEVKFIDGYRDYPVTPISTDLILHTRIYNKSDFPIILDRILFAVNMEKMFIKHHAFLGIYTIDPNLDRTILIEVPLEFNVMHYLDDKITGKFTMAEIRYAAYFKGYFFDWGVSEGNAKIKVRWRQ